MKSLEIFNLTAVFLFFFSGVFRILCGLSLQAISFLFLFPKNVPRILFFVLGLF